MVSLWRRCCLCQPCPPPLATLRIRGLSARGSRGLSARVTRGLSARVSRGLSARGRRVTAVHRAAEPPLVLARSSHCTLSAGCSRAEVKHRSQVRSGHGITRSGHGLTDREVTPHHHSYCERTYLCCKLVLCCFRFECSTFATFALTTIHIWSHNSYVDVVTNDST